MFFISQDARERQRMVAASIVTISKNSSGLDLSVAFKRFSANLVKVYLNVCFVHKQFRYRPCSNHYRSLIFCLLGPLPKLHLCFINIGTHLYCKLYSFVHCVHNAHTYVLFFGISSNTFISHTNIKHYSSNLM
jgi:hypothetical protein